MSESRRPKQAVATIRVFGTDWERRSDSVATEEPLAIRVVSEMGGKRVRSDVAVTMRTPGYDEDLAVGFLQSEGVLNSTSDIWKVEHCRDPEVENAHNTVDVFLNPGVEFDEARFSRHVYTSSSCGICGKASMDQVRAVGIEPAASGFRISAGVLCTLPAKLEAEQPLFAETGGIHGAALFDGTGRLLTLREDVGRHNAVDKILGSLVRSERGPAEDLLLLVSGRASFELVQKALVGGIPMMAAVGAPSSLAISLAREFGMTLVGFLKQDRFNIYVGEERISAEY